MAKAKPTTLGAYRDCAEVLDKAKQGDLRIRFATRGKAINFRQRCYALRKILLAKSEEITPPGHIPSTPYDDIYIQWSEKDETALIFRRHRSPGEVEFLEPHTVEPVDDPFLREAQNFAASLLKDLK